MTTETGLTTIDTTNLWDAVSLFNVNRMSFLRFKKIKPTHTIYFCLKVDSIKAVSNFVKEGREIIEISIDPEILERVEKYRYYMGYIFNYELQALNIYFDADTHIGKIISDIFFGIT